MKYEDWQLTIRELRLFLSSARVIAVLCGVAVLATVTQPFGFRVPGHLLLTFIYWILIIAITFPLGFIISTWSERSFRMLPSPLSIGIAAICMGACVTVVTFAMNVVFLDWAFGEIRLWRIIASSAFPTAAIVTVLVGLGIGGRRTPVVGKRTTPALLERVPFDKRGRIIHLAAEDHYTRVSTTKGTELILIRFSDAMREAEPTNGIQIHRSHWISLDHIEKIRRDADGGVVTLSNGVEVPISRSRLKPLKDMRLL